MLRRTRSTLITLAAPALVLAGLAGCTPTPPADSDPPAPSEPAPSAPAPSATAPTGGSLEIDEMDDDRLALIDLDAVAAGDALVLWVERGDEVGIVLGGSGSAACVPQPVSATMTGATTLAVEFESNDDPNLMCTADFRLWGWEIDIDDLGDDATLTVEVTGVGDAPITVELGPDDPELDD